MAIDEYSCTKYSRANFYYIYRKINFFTLRESQMHFCTAQDFSYIKPDKKSETSRTMRGAVML